MKTDIDGMAATIATALAEYDQDAADRIRDVVQEVAQNCLKAIRKASPKKTGEYRKGWKKTVTVDKRSDIKIVVHNTAKPWLTHLLENGHSKRTGGRTRAIPHIAPAKRAAAEELEQKIRQVIE